MKVRSISVVASVLRYSNFPGTGYVAGSLKTGLFDSKVQNIYLSNFNNRFAIFGDRFGVACFHRQRSISVKR